MQVPCSCARNMVVGIAKELLAKCPVSYLGIGVGHRLTSHPSRPQKDAAA